MYTKHLPKKKIAAIIRCFYEDLTATATAALVGTSRNTVNSYFNEIRQRIFQRSLQESNQELGEFELDESYFGAKRIRGKRGRGAASKMPNEVYFNRCAANSKPYIETRPLVKQRTDIAGKANSKIKICLDFLEGRLHLPILKVERT